MRKGFIIHFILFAVLFVLLLCEVTKWVTIPMLIIMFIWELFDSGQSITDIQEEKLGVKDIEVLEIID